ncbi:hypothetical protein, partial [Reyranella sp.]|uniref:hypothetical protein n=1 Tax=Reyranella sp. TaxID=1929291 RepID=UPI0027161F2D
MAGYASSLTVAQYRALGYSPAPGPYPVAIVDTGAAIAAMTLDEFEMFVWQGISILHSSDGLLSLTVEQYTALGVSVLSGGDGATIPGPSGTVSLTASDEVTLADTRAALSALTAARIAELAGRGIDRVDATDNLLNLTVAKFNALGTVALTVADVVTLSDTGANLA